MTTAVADGLRRIAPSERIGTMMLLVGALRRTRDRVGPLAALWLAMGIGTLLIAQIDIGVTPPPSAVGASLTPIGMAKGTLNAMLGGFAAAFGVRILLQGPARWREVDRPLLECAALMTALEMALILPSWALAVPPLFGFQLDPTAAGLAVLGLMIAGVYAALKLVIWPIGRLMGRPDVTAFRSWRLMRKATRGYILAHAILFVPVVVAYAGVYIRQGAAALDSGRVDGVLGFLLAAINILSMAIDATIYTVRVENPATVADVFD